LAKKICDGADLIDNQTIPAGRSSQGFFERMSCMNWTLGRDGRGAWIGLLLVSLAIAGPAKVTAQDSALDSSSTVGSGGLTSIGSHTLKLRPTRLRVVIEVRGEGRSGADALRALADQKTRVNQELQEMRADRESVDFSAPKISIGYLGFSDWNHPTLQNLIRRGLVPADPYQADADLEQGEVAMPKSFVAISRATAEWGLPTDDADALALLPETLRKQVAQRDLTGKKKRLELTDEEQEQWAELQRQAGNQNFFAQNQNPTQSDVQWVYVAPLDPKLEQEAIQAAYQEAQRRATALAAASQLKLGRVIRLSHSDRAAEAILGTYDGTQSRPVPAQLLGRTGEIVATEPEGLRKVFTVQMVHEILH
jgi:uncharacterized protein YggE